MKTQKIFSILVIAFLLFTIMAPSANVAAASTSKPLTDTVMSNDNLLAMKYTGTWNYEYSLAGFFDGDKHYSSFTDAYVEFKFNAYAVSILAQVGPDQGKADIYIDGTLDQTIDLYQPTISTQVAVYHNGQLTLGEHTIKMVVRGDKNDSSTGTAINIDAIRVDDGGSNSAPPGANDPMLHPYSYGIGVFGAPYNHNVGSTMVCVPDSSGYAVTVNCSGTMSGQTSLGGRLRAELQFSVTNVTTSQTVNIQMTGTVNNGNASISCSPSCDATTVSTSGSPGFSGDVWVDLIAADGASTTYSAYYTIIISMQPIQDSCVKKYVTLTTDGPYTIDPTIETPQGVIGQPTPIDEQIYPTKIGQWYAVRDAGGPWNDGSNQSYALQYSWDGVNWSPFEGGCILRDPVQQYLVTAYLQAESTTLYMRVADASGQFSDNSNVDDNSPMQYFVSLEFVQGQNDCSSQFTYDQTADWVASANIMANSSSTTVTTALTPGDWYVIQIATGAWQDDGSPPDRYDAQYSFGNVMDGSADNAIYKVISSTSTDSFCQTSSGNYVTIFVQADGSSNLYMRVNDQAETWDANTGMLGVNVYHTSYTRTTAGCELQYGIDQLVGHTDIPAQAEDGITIGISSPITQQQLYGSMMLEPGAWYMLETNGGPWGWLGATHNAKSYDLAVFWNGQWLPLSDWAEAICNIQIDSLGHRRVFFQTPATGAAEYKFRVNDTDLWTNNIGSLGVDLYQAYDNKNSLPNGTCDFKYDQTQVPINSAWIDATQEDGTGFTKLNDNTIYAFIITDEQHWAENTTDWNNNVALYTAQFSDDNGTTWHDVPNNYGGVMCYLQVGNQTTLFIKTGANMLYRMRVASTSFADNRGGLTVKVYPASPGDTINPWTTNCMSAFGSADALFKYPIDSFEWIDVKNKDGKPVISNQRYLNDPSIVGYIVEISNGPWNTNDVAPGEPDARFDAALSKDNGATWHAIGLDNPDILCADYAESLKIHWRAYFSVASGDTWKIRVNDDDNANWGNNGGNLAFKLWAVTGQAAPNCVLDTNRADCLPPGTVIDINGQDACTMVLTTPTVPTTIDPADWISYASDVMTYDIDAFAQWMAWCPQHTSALENLLSLFNGKEPLATIQEFLQLLKEVQNQMNAYNWNDSTAPQSVLDNSNGVVDNVMNKIFPSMSSSNPWAGGPLVSFNKHWSPSSYYYACVSNFQDLLGPILPSPVCFASDEMRETGASFFIQILLDIGVAFWGLRTIWGDAMRLAHFMVGVTYVPPNSGANIKIDLSGNGDVFSTNNRSSGSRRMF